MKNLKVIHKSKRLNLDVTAYCIDPDNRVLHILGEGVSKPEPPSLDGFDLDCKLINTSLINGFPASEDSKNDVKLMEFVVEIGGILLVLGSGEIFLIDVSSFSPDCKGLTYKHLASITSAKLSPDQKLIALADSSNNINVLDVNSCQLLHKSNFILNEDSLNVPVGVGWGSKETQFFGLDGRPSKEKHNDESIPNAADLGGLEEIETRKKFQDDREALNCNCVIDWRGDGQFLATLAHIENVDKHTLKVWNRNLQLQYMSEKLVTIERGLMSWIPNGQFICCAQRRNRIINEIVLFEKNGMAHQRFALPSLLRYLYTRSFSWSPDSKIFAIVANRYSIDRNITFKPILMLYTTQNFQYNLKFTYHLDDDAEYHVKWDLTDQNKIHLISHGGHYLEFYCTFEATFSDTNSTVGVIDANKVKLTPLSICNIPPPMCALTIELKNQLIQRLIMDPCKDDNLYIITTGDEIVSIGGSRRLLSEDHMRLVLNNQMAKKLRQNMDYCSVHEKLTCARSLQYYQNFIVVKESVMLATYYDGEKTDLVKVTLFDKDPVDTYTLTSIEKEVVYLTSSRRNRQIVVAICGDGSYYVFNLEELSLSSFGKQIASTNIKSSFKFLFAQAVDVPSWPRVAVISLSHDSTLRYNSFTIATSCTSFRTTESFLIYTSVDDNLHFILLQKLYNHDLASCSAETWCQRIETGATLITASETSGQVVLQMPRGNLEMLHPRVLIFSLLTSLLDDESYLEAIKLSRRHRLNMNFLCDYLLRISSEPEKVFHEFGKQVAKIDSNLLLLLITELQDVDTTSERYKTDLIHLPKRKVDVNETLPADMVFGKTNKICTYFLKSFEDGNQDVMKCKLLCFIKMRPQRIGQALSTIKAMEKDVQLEALKYMHYFIDFDQLFDEALGTYDTETTIMVAEASHKDPKEYLPLLKEFDAIENIVRRKYKIDMHLKRYSKVVNYLIDLHISKILNEDEFEELIGLVCRHKLYKIALSRVSEPSCREVRSRLWVKYAEYLFSKRCYFEAGLAYSNAHQLGNYDNPLEIKNFSSAMDCYFLCDKWQVQLSLIRRFPSDESVKYLKRIRSKLMDDNDYHIFANALVLDTKFDSENLDSLIRRGGWYMAEFYDPGIVDQLIRPILKEKINEIIVELEEGLELANQHMNRLKFLLSTYLSRKLSNLRNEVNIPDGLSTIDGSELSSITSDSSIDGDKMTKSATSSIKTRKTSRANKTKAIKEKRISLKEGTRNEDLALILEIQKYMNNLKDLQTRSLEIAHATFDYFGYKFSSRRVEKINDLLVESHKFCEDTSGLLWPTMPQHEQKYSLYRRFNNLLTDSNGQFDNKEFAVLIKPSIPSLIRFEF